MSTQGMISIVDENDKTLVKVVAGCNGFQAKELAQMIETNHLINKDDIKQAAILCNFGCSECLVILDKDTDYTNFHSRYKETFDNPKFNPRWDCGLVGYLEMICIPKS